MNALPTLTTARLTLRPPVADDADALFATMADAAAMRWWSCAPFEDIDALRAYLADGSAWSVVHDGRVAGFVSVHDRRPEVTEIGYLFVHAARGHGIAREAVAAAIAERFAAGYRRIFADTDPDNTASIRLLEALGFTCEGRLRGEWRTHIGVRDTLLYGLLSDDPR
ncbi:GNAT family N-acetyltransferase [Sphingomonas sp. A2-49]|uniref:GNAT family N-acetyltransferase n=1 Tax=Sphingomonas sp. A2-49 TaxID=1391375 RepID=UPI0021D24389|nr:GNAT family N-acetyltransferase [Sphingomonas sp. A2-49]MCU6453641.1 GNAT family N-acetyltransferase [Sphingomonas sp. A2-49]